MRALLAPILALSLFAAPLQAEPTQLEVSALAHGAKFIGDRSGGARITITDAETGEILAEGITTGGTGNTRLIMAAEQPHWDSIATEGTASFVTELDIDSPLQLAITASGPLDAAPEDRVRASVMSWLLPGDSRTGDRRVIIELPGYLVDVLNIKQTEGRLEATVDISMLCGCPVIPGGWWDATRIDMQARLVGA
ncbi:MAG: hypothetical protein R3217_10605, partial [Gammaproteobacteria bacterium]|nr:hypothetical protein [Gammaproteobacteria bacterium]